jgi:hypothetical protein
MNPSENELPEVLGTSPTEAVAQEVPEPVTPVTPVVEPDPDATLLMPPKSVKPKKSASKMLHVDEESADAPPLQDVAEIDGGKLVTIDTLPTPEPAAFVPNPNIVTVDDPRYPEWLRKMMVQGKGKEFKHQGRDWTPIRDSHDWKFISAQPLQHAVGDQYEKTSFI